MVMFVQNGPDIPDTLLHKHEEGKAVFFCGSGISRPAKLPNFKELAEETYSRLMHAKDTRVQSAIDAGKYDTAIDLLDNIIAGGRHKVRKTIQEILTPDDNALTKTHESLLTLARHRDGQTRLITTNFDRLFERAIHAQKPESKIHRFKAPLLPIPKESWSGLVYLHGLLPRQETENKLNNLVLSSGDFGLAYLMDRWAARFVSAILRKHTVCFVGYSMNDIVLRYMMDALAADHALGENPLEMFAFTDHPQEKQDAKSEGWLPENITQIPYDSNNKHEHLHETLHAWANIHRDGINGKKMVVARHAQSPPPPPPDFETGQMLWALTSDVSAATHFADMNSVPSFEWLKPLTNYNLKRDDLLRFACIPNDNTKVHDKDIKFSILQRPTPYTHSLWMGVVNFGVEESRWDPTMRQLARWLTRHLNNPALIIWLSEQGGQPTLQFADLIRDEIAKIEEHELKGEQQELDEIRANAPDAIPSKPMRKLWGLFLANRIGLIPDSHLFYTWKNRIKAHGVTPSLRLELRDILKPHVTLHQPYSLGGEQTSAHQAQCISDLVHCEFVLRDNNFMYQLPDLENDPQWQAALPDLLQDFTALLRDTMDLKRELEYANDKSDYSSMEQRSISPHPQNNRFHSWTALIEFCRDAWLATAEKNPAKARRVAEDWWHTPYPVFKRLSLFAATKTDFIDHNQALNWLSQEDSWWLWSSETLRETIRLLVKVTPKLNQPNKNKLARMILTGPPREMYKKELTPIRIDYEIWLRLVKIHQANKALNKATTTKLEKLTRKHPDWKLADDERDEFSTWFETGVGEPEVTPIPLDLNGLIQWIKKEKLNPLSNSWRTYCTTRYPRVIVALRVLSEQGDWSEKVSKKWDEALRAWAEEKHAKISWHRIAPILKNAPDDFIAEYAHAISWWLEAIAKTVQSHEDIFFSLCNRILTSDLSKHQEEDIRDPLTTAINHPIGLVVGALFGWWGLTKFKIGQGIHEKLVPTFTKICNRELPEFRHGRSALARRFDFLYKIDTRWTEKHLVPLFDWDTCETEAHIAWSSFLYGPSLYLPLLISIKKPLLETAKHYEKISTRAMQYTHILTTAALDKASGFHDEEFAESMQNLPENGLTHVTYVLTQNLEGAGEQHDEYWRNRIVPFFEKIWPRDRSNTTPEVSAGLSTLCVAAGDLFPEALKLLSDWLQPGASTFRAVYKLHKSGLCKKFPKESLCFLSKIIGSHSPLWSGYEVRSCLDKINAHGEFSNHPKFIQLDNLLRKMGC